MLSKMRYLFPREGFTSTKIYKRMQNNEFFNDKNVFVGQKYENVKQKCFLKKKNP